MKKSKQSVLTLALLGLFGATIACGSPAPADEGNSQSTEGTQAAAHEQRASPEATPMIRNCGYECSKNGVEIIELSLAACARICPGGAAACVPGPPPPCP